MSSTCSSTRWPSVSASDCSPREGRVETPIKLHFGGSDAYDSGVVHLTYLPAA